MARGTIKTIREDRGFGFITPDGERNDIFFHRNAVQGAAFEELQTGQQVEYEPGTDPRDPSRRRAENVRLIEG